MNLNWNFAADVDLRERINKHYITWFVFLK